jgi:DNA invertase Pin-like site-specific DNA recombinase
MPKRYTASVALLAHPGENKALPLEQPIAIYYRQSTDNQVGNVSTSMQTVDMVKYLQGMGWAASSIIMIDMDKGVSGSTKIDERPGMSALFELITRRKIGAVACQDEDRLFRDVTQIQVNIFIEACRAANVLVLTPSMVYDFANELTGAFHARQFRFKAEMAAEYINSIIRGKLHRAKQRLLMEGRWGGGGIPPGYMVDVRKTLPNGSPNPTWKRYVPFEPYAEVVIEYFRLFLTHSGSVRATVNHIQEYGPFYPDPKTCKPPDGFKVNYKIVRYRKGYCPGRTGLAGLLTNAAYLGHWQVNDTIVRWNNHQAIVSEEVFFKAFNYLAETGLDGQANPHYQPIHDHARPSREVERTVERPLCAGLVVSQHQGEWRNVGTNWVGPQQRYAYVLWSTGPGDAYVWSKAATYFDEAIVRLLHYKLRATFDANVWEETASQFVHDYQRQRKQLDTQLRTLGQVMTNLVASLGTLTNAMMIRAAQDQYEQAQAEQERLQELLRAMDAEANELKSLLALKDNCEPVLENWSNMTRDEQRVVLTAFINRIEAMPVAGHGLHLVICWRDNKTDEITLPRQSTTGTNWLPEETERLLELLGTAETQMEIAQEFPGRKWKDIRLKVAHETGESSKLKFRPKPIKDDESYQDYLHRTGLDSDADSFTDMGSGMYSGTARRDGPGRFRPAAATARRRPARRS